MTRRLVPSLLAALLGLTLSGCALGPAGYGPGGVNPAFVYAADQTYPAANTSGTIYQLTTDDFEIRGLVMAEGSSTNILGLYSRGNNGYESLLQQVRGQGADDVMNLRMDVSYTNVLFLYQRVDTRLTGQAVRWKR